MNYIGIDYHKQHFTATIMDERGKIISKEKVSTDITDRAENLFVSKTETGCRERKYLMEVIY